jgi:hypothetical protein
VAALGRAAVATGLLGRVAAAQVAIAVVAPVLEARAQEVDLARVVQGEAAVIVPLALELADLAQEVPAVAIAVVAQVELALEVVQALVDPARAAAELAPAPDPAQAVVDLEEIVLEAVQGLVVLVVAEVAQEVVVEVDGVPVAAVVVSKSGL